MVEAVKNSTTKNGRFGGVWLDGRSRYSVKVTTAHPNSVFKVTAIKFHLAADTVVTMDVNCPAAVTERCGFAVAQVCELTPHGEDHDGNELYHAEALTTGGEAGAFAGLSAEEVTRIHSGESGFLLRYEIVYEVREGMAEKSSADLKTHVCDCQDFPGHQLQLFPQETEYAFGWQKWVADQYPSTLEKYGLQPHDVRVRGPADRWECDGFYSRGSDRFPML